LISKQNKTKQQGDVMENIVFGLGIFLLIAAITGGGLKALGYEVKEISSVRRQIILAALGAVLMVAGQWNAVYSIINPLQTSTTSKGPITLESGVARTIPLSLPYGGEVEVAVQNLSQDWSTFTGARGQPGQDSVYVGVCPSSAKKPCEKMQLQAGQVYRNELPPGAANISLFNFSTSPTMTVTFDVVYPNRRKFD
jgi:hypothetical protein